MAELFGKHGLDRLAVWIDGNPGEAVSEDRGHDVRRVRLGNEVFYLKRRWAESRAALLGMLLYGKRPVSGPVREAMLARDLESAGFTVMEAVAWGERRKRGLPVKGFVLVRAVEGRSLEEGYRESDGKKRREILLRLGRLTGRLHREGFFHHVRLKDLIESPEGELVLIDRESGKPWRRRFSLKAALAALARTARRTLRDGNPIGADGAGAFFRGYCEEASGALKMSAGKFRAMTVRRFRREMERRQR